MAANSSDLKFNLFFQLNFVINPWMCRWLFGYRCDVGKRSISLRGLMTPGRIPLWCSLGGNRTTGLMWKMSFLFSHSLLALPAALGKRWNASYLVHFIWLVTTFSVLGRFHMHKKLVLRPQLCRCRSDDGVLAWHSWPLAPHKKQGWCTQLQFQNLGEWRKEEHESKVTPAP